MQTSLSKTDLRLPQNTLQMHQSRTPMHHFHPCRFGPNRGRLSRISAFLRSPWKPIAGNTRIGARPHTQETRMMNDARDIQTPPVEVGNNGKIIAAVAVALGFVAMGAFSYESGTWNSSPKQIVAAKSVTAPAPAPLASAEPSVTAPSPTNDLPPLPEKSAEAKPAPAATAPAKTPPMRIARAQIPAVTPQVPAALETPAEPQVNNSAQAAPAPAAPADQVASPATESAPAAVEAAPAPVAPEQPAAEPAPAQ
jgi:hypothetical protein